MRTIASSTLLVIGIALLGFSSYRYWQITNPNRLAFANAYESLDQVSETSDINPNLLLIPSINVEVPIRSSELKEKEWQTVTDGVSYLVSSPIPGKEGNSILYGHNWKSLLGDLPQMKPGAQVEIVYTNGDKKTFIVETTQEVSPNDVSILKNTKDTRITIYTCSGLFDSKRFVVTAVYDKPTALSFQ
jgi:LPXTG-site transpeptidase (sortase) family protein